MTRVLIIGGIAAGMKAAATARRPHSLIPGQQLYGRCVWTRLSLGGRTFGR